MSELLYKLKEWLTVPDAAAHLSIAFGEEVTEADVLRLGLDRHLTLSVNFVNHGHGRLGKVVPVERATVVMLKTLMPGEKPLKTVKGTYLSNGEVLEFVHPEETKVDSIDGIWDLPMCGGERLDVEHWNQELTGGPDVTLINLGETFVNRPDGTWCQLHVQLEVRVRDQDGDERVWIKTEALPNGSKLVMREKGFKGHLRERSWIPAGGLPDDAVLVVRTAALDDLKARVSKSSPSDGGEPPSEDKRLGTTERTSLLIIIAGLAKRAQIDVAKPSQAAKAILAEIDRLGAKVGQRTIEEHLKKIPDALERRG